MKEWEVYHPSEGEKRELVEMVIREEERFHNGQEEDSEKEAATQAEA